MHHKVFGACLLGWAVSASPAAGQTLPHGVPDLCAALADRTVVAAGSTVTWSGAKDASCVEVRGTLRIDSGTRATVGTILVYPGGWLDIGTPDRPVTGVDLAIRDEPLDLTRDPEQYGHGLVVFGRLTTHGTPKTSWLRLAAEPRAGGTTLTLSAAPVGWQAGDTLILPDTRHLRDGEIYANYRPQWEELKIAAVSDTTVTLAAPLKFDHVGARNLDGVLEFLPHVGNLTRSAVLRSANPAGTRGHTIFMHRADVDIRYAEFRDLGRTTIAPLDCTRRKDGAAQSEAHCTMGSGEVVHVGTNQIGRYPIHFHHLMGPAKVERGRPQFAVVGNAVVHTPKWGITVHNSHFGLVQDNVVYDAGGAGIMTEDGNETGNLIEKNFVVRSFGTGGREGAGREGTALYLRGPLNRVRGNVAANILSDGPDAAYGYKLYFPYLDKLARPKGPGSDQTEIIDGNNVEMAEFADNEVYGATESGLTFWWVGWGMTYEYGPQPPTARAPSVIKNLRVWHVYNRGIFQYQSAAVTIDGFVVRGLNPTGSACCSMGYEGGDYIADGVTLRNADIQGMMIGIQPTTLVGARIGEFRVETSFLRNYMNVAINTMSITAPTPDSLRPRRTVLDRVTFRAPPPAANRPYYAIATNFQTGGVRTLIQRDEVVVQAYNGVAGDDFRVFYREQAGDFVIPPSVPLAEGVFSVKGAPAPNLTNTQAWATHKIAVAGAVAPCASTRPEILGFTCAGAVSK
jgi:hypothetical protein